MKTTLSIVWNPGDAPKELEVVQLEAGKSEVTDGEIEPVWIIRCECTRFELRPSATMSREGTYAGGHELHNLPWLLPENPPPAERIEITPVVPPPDEDALIAGHPREAAFLHQRTRKKLESALSFEQSRPYIAANLLHRVERAAKSPPAWLTTKEREVVFTGRPERKARGILSQARWRAVFKGHDGIVRRYLLASVGASPVKQDDKALRLRQLAEVEEKKLRTITAERQLEALRRERQQADAKNARDRAKQPVTRADVRTALKVTTDRGVHKICARQTVDWPQTQGQLDALVRKNDRHKRSLGESVGKRNRDRAEKRRDPDL